MMVTDATTTVDDRTRDTILPRVRFDFKRLKCNQYQFKTEILLRWQLDGNRTIVVVFLLSDPHETTITTKYISSSSTGQVRTKTTDYNAFLLPIVTITLASHAHLSKSGTTRYELGTTTQQMNISQIFLCSSLLPFHPLVVF